MVFLPLRTQLLDARLLAGLIQRLIGIDSFHRLVHVAAQHDIRAAAGHVGGNGDHLGTPGLRHDIGFAGMLLGVEHLMRQLLFLQQLGNDFRVLNRRGAHQYWLPALVAFADVLDGCFVFFAGRFVDAVQLVIAAADAVGRNNDGFQAVNFLELVGLCVGSAGHTGQFAVKAEVVLERDGRQRLVFSLNLHALFGLYRLVQTITPTAPGHQTAGKFVNDDDFAVLHHIVLIAVIKVVSTQSSVQVVHERDVGRVVQRRSGGNQAQLRKYGFSRLVPLLCEEHLVTFFIHGEVAGLGDSLPGMRVGLALLLGEPGNRFVDRDVELCVIFRLTADDQGCAGLVDQNRVHLIHDGVVQTALYTVRGFVHHVVAQVVEPVFVVSAVGNV